MLNNYANRLIRKAIKTDAFRVVAEELGMKVRVLKRNLLHKPKKVQDALDKLSRKQKEAIFGQFTGAEYDSTETKILSSSWIIAGEFNRNKQKKNGTLVLLIGKKKYRYFNVPQTTWKLMTQAKGRNGTGAGTIFWRYYLHRYQRARGKFRMGILLEIKGINPRRKR